MSACSQSLALGEIRETDWGHIPVVKHLPCIWKALNSILKHPQNNPKSLRRKLKYKVFKTQQLITHTPGGRRGERGEGEREKGRERGERKREKERENERMRGREEGKER